MVKKPKIGKKYWACCFVTRDFNNPTKWVSPKQVIFKYICTDNGYLAVSLLNGHKEFIYGNKYLFNTRESVRHLYIKYLVSQVAYHQKICDKMNYELYKG